MFEVIEGGTMHGLRSEEVGDHGINTRRLERMLDRWSEILQDYLSFDTRYLTLEFFALVSNTASDVYEQRSVRVRICREAIMRKDIEPN